MSNQQLPQEDLVKLDLVLTEIFKQKALAIKKASGGQFNQVYLADFADQKVVVKIFTDPEEPIPGKDVWLDHLLELYSIPHAKLLYSSRANTFYTYGLSIFTFVEGGNIREAIDKKSITEEEYVRLAAKLLKPIHAIKLAKYGYDTTSDVMEFMIDPMLKINDCQFVKDYNLAEPIAVGTEIVHKIITKYKERFVPVLTHGDCAAKNTVQSPTQGDLLIDWDNSEGNVWLADYSWLLFWWRRDHVSQEQIAHYEKAFFSSYGTPQDFTQAEIAEIVYAFHIRTAILILQYFFEVRQDLNEFDAVQRFLDRLIHGDNN